MPADPLDVREPIIPDRLPFRTATTWNWSLEDYFGRPLTAEEKRVFWDFFLDQRLSPTAFFAKTPDPSPAEAVALKDRGPVGDEPHVRRGQEAPAADAGRSRRNWPRS